MKPPSHKQKSVLAFPGFSWVIVAISALILFFSGPGQTFNVSVFINSYIESEGWSRSAVSGFYSMATLTAGLLMPISGRLVDWKGHRVMTPLIATMLAVACFWMSFISAPWMLLIGFFMIRLMGQGSMTLLASTLTPRWFIRKRGIAFSLTMMGGVAGSALIPVISNRLIVAYGPGFAWRFWAVMLIAIMVPLGWLLIRNRPEDIGMGPDGTMAYEMKTTDVHEKVKVSLPFSHAGDDWTPGEAMKTSVFWVMLFCMLVPSMITTGIVFHLVSIIGGKGFDSSFAALILSLTAIVQLPVTFMAGWLCDHFPVHRIKALNYILLAASMLLLLYSPSRQMLIVYAVIHGIFTATDHVSSGAWWPNNFGLRHLGSIRGLGMTSMVIGSALGPLPFGFAFDIFGNYELIILSMMIFPAAAGIAAILSPPPLKNNSE